jgi:hypothetical protein
VRVPRGVLDVGADADLLPYLVLQIGADREEGDGARLDNASRTGAEGWFGARPAEWAARLSRLGDRDVVEVDVVGAAGCIVAKLE